MDTTLQRRMVLWAMGMALAIGLVVALAAFPAGATYAGKNGMVAFTRIDPETEVANIFTANPNGSHEIRLTSFDSGSPDWSPDGTRIAFEFVSSYDPFELNIATINPDGTGFVQLTSGAPFIHAEPNWSPDGTRIAFNSANGIRTMDADTGDNVVRVTNPCGKPCGLMDMQPSWSLDGKWIAFVRLRHDRHRQMTALFLVHPNGTGLHRLSAWGTNTENPDWSPDGKLIAFNSKGTVPAPSRIFTIRPDGSGQTALVETKASGDFHDPSWSPDGNKLIFQGWLERKRSVDSSKVRSLWMANSDGSALHKIDKIAPQVVSPDWGTYPLAR